MVQPFKLAEQMRTLLRRVGVSARHGRLDGTRVDVAVVERLIPGNQQ